ncbi:aromatic alcohol reductase [Aspergillus stella-maris]|uniref:aromatic alcohol reductase n=1 Tax=Aspergillus stella-maris TaxID=1810926 RepID=UPI003CCD8F01
MAPTNVIIVGANGLLGRHLVSAFTSDLRFTVSILTRQHSQPPTSTSYTAASHTELVKILAGQDVLISVLASHAVAQQKTLIDAAIDAGVRHFIPSEFGFDSRNEEAGKLLPGFLVSEKREVVRFLRSKEEVGLRWTAFVTGVFLETSIPTYLGFDLANKRANLSNSSASNYWSTTTLSTAALAVKSALLLPASEISNKYLFFESFNVSQKGILTTLEEMTGESWDVSYCDAEEEKRVADAVEKLAQGDYAALPDVMRYAICTPGYGADYMRYERKANELLGLPGESLRSALARILNNHKP